MAYNVNTSIKSPYYQTNDLYLQQDSFKRRRALLQALQDQSMKAPIVGVGNAPYIQALEKIGTTALTNEGQSGIDQQEQGNVAAIQGDMQNEIAKYLTTMRGQPGTISQHELSDLPGPNIPRTDPTPPDPEAAVYSALASRHPQMQAVGQAGLKELLMPPKFEQHEGNILRIPTSGIRNETPSIVGNISDPWKLDYMDIDGTGKRALVRINMKTGKVEQVATGTNVNVDLGQKANEVAQTDAIKAISPGGESFKDAVSAQKNLTYTNEAARSLARGAPTGAGENVLFNLRKYAERFLPDIDLKSVDQQALVSLLKSRVVQEAGGNLGRQISDADVRWLNAASGDITTDPTALKRLLAISAAISAQKLHAHNALVDDMSDRANGLGFLQNYRRSLNYVPAGDQQFNDMFDKAMQGKPTVDAPDDTSPPVPTGKAPVGTVDKPIIRGFPKGK